MPKLDLRNGLMGTMVSSLAVLNGSMGIVKWETLNAQKYYGGTEND